MENKMEKLKLFVDTLADTADNSSSLILKKVLELYCNQNQCIHHFSDNHKKELFTLLIDCKISYCINDFNDILSTLQNEFAYSNIACVMEILYNLFNDYIVKEGESLDEDLLKAELLKLCVICLDIPDKVIPILSEQEFNSTEKYKENCNSNIRLTEQSLKFYLTCLLSPVKRYIVKKISAKVVIMISCRLGNFSWTNQNVKKLSNQIIQSLCQISNQKNISTILSGTTDPSNQLLLFQDGLLGTILTNLSAYFNQDKWEKNLTVKHSFLWCLTKVKYPYLDKHIQKLIPPLLIMMDSFKQNEKILGVTSTQYLIDNVNPSILLLYNHALVIYDTLFKMLYSSNEILYEICLPVLESILLVIERKPGDICSVEYTKWDTCFEKIFNNAEYANNVTIKRIFLKAMEKFIKHLNGNSIKHFDNILSTVAYSLQHPDGQKEEARFHALAVLKEAMSSCWPIIPKYVDTIFKILIKLLVDLNYPGLTIKAEIKLTLLEKIYEILVLLKDCDKLNFNETLKTLTMIKYEPQFTYIQEMLLKLSNESF